MLLLPALLAASAPTAYPQCETEDLELSLDGLHGVFDGMQQSGTLLVLRNLGSSPCTVPGLPKVELLDAKGKMLPISRKVPVGMHPGPVILPVAIPSNYAEVTAQMGWVEGPVFPKTRCYAPRTVTVTIGGKTVGTRFAGKICGPQDGQTTFSQSVLHRDAGLPDD